jgi:protein-S-isoprenylcysteine O-methyltransferase Ste14
MRLIPILLVVEAAMAAILFTSAGQLDLPWFWALIGAHTTLMGAGFLSMDRDLQRERVRPGPGGESRSFRLVAIPFILAHLIVAGLDAGRYGWSGVIPDVVHAIALAAYVGGLSLAIWAMRVNRFFSPVIRIQGERGHVVVSGGPYRYIRHPGYAGAILAVLSGAVVLGSWWSIVPAMPFLVLIAARLTREDRFLKERLAGYAEYARQTRYRLLPRIW